VEITGQHWRSNATEITHKRRHGILAWFYLAMLRMSLRFKVQHVHR